MADAAHPKNVVITLQEIQERDGFIRRKDLPDIADDLGVPLYHLYGVITFFPHFRLDERPPKLEVRVCTDLSCRLREGAALLERCRAEVALRRPDQLTVATTSCLGRCDGAPALTVNDVPYCGLDGAAMDALVAALGGRGEFPDAPASPKLSGVKLDPYGNGQSPWAALKKVLATMNSGIVAAEYDVIAQLKEAKLRGLGGAGFTAGIKWETVCKTPAKPKYVICNADESEPGTIKDRAILTSVPHLLIEGMVIAAVLTGAEHGYIYIRHEYGPEKKLVDAAIARAKKDHVLGSSVLGSSHAFEIEPFTSPGGYICGEETALMEAIEGKRAQPRLKGLPPAIKGLWGQPTVINNVETFTHVPAIILNGPKWYREQGVQPGVGLKFMGISGDVARPGVYEIPMGTSLQTVIDTYAGGMRTGRPLKAFVPSGASSGVLPASDAQTPLEWEALKKKDTMLGSSAIIVLDDSRCMVDLALNIARFFARESCGKCWPCRVGSEKIADMLEAVTRGRAKPDVFEPLGELKQTLFLTSICGLGQVVPSPIASVQRYFPEEVRAHVSERRCPENVCPMA